MHKVKRFYPVSVICSNLMTWFRNDVKVKSNNAKCIISSRLSYKKLNELQLHLHRNGRPGTAFRDTTTELIKLMILCTLKGAHRPTDPSASSGLEALPSSVRSWSSLTIHRQHVEVQRIPAVSSSNTGSSEAEELAFIFCRVQGPQVISISSVEAVTLRRQLYSWDLRPGIMHIPL